MDNSIREARNVLFQELKPYCVALSQLALKSDGSASFLKNLREATGKLLHILEEKCQRSDGVFDDKLADYVFFPLSHVLRDCQKNPGRLAEIATRCLRILLEYGWRKGIAVDLSQQLLLLLTYFADSGPATPGISEELKTEAYNALAALFKDIQHSTKGVAALVEASSIPALGQCLSVLLDGVKDGPSQEAQLAALKALKSMWISIKDQATLSNFLPGTISALTKCLTPSTTNLRARKVLVSGLQVFQVVLTTVLSDVRTRNFTDSDTVGNAAGKENGKAGTLTKSWLKATASQIKLALGNIVKLRGHEHGEVREELANTCIIILDECHSSLSDSTVLVVETSMIISSFSADTEIFSSRTTLKDLATIHPSIAESIKDIIYKWATSLPRVMQSSDESAKTAALHQLSNVQNLLSGLDMESNILDDMLADSLRNSIVNTLELPSSSKGLHEAPNDNSINPVVFLNDQKTLVQDYRPILMPHASQSQTREQFCALIANVGSSETQVKMAGDMLERLHNTSGNDLLSSFWLCFQLLKAAASRSEDLDDFISADITSSDEREAVMDELYSYSVAALSESDDKDTDWRAQALSLEVVSYSAERLGSAFRPDLVDAIYPAVQLLGSSHTILRTHAIACLNIMSTACGYNDTSEMIVQNVDYLVNAISLKLNTFDISPQAPQVLVMMIRLSGSSLLPYLDDVVGSIFAALDNFHGYARLVDSLFSVLGEIVDESGRSGQLRLTSGSEISHRKLPVEGPKISDIIEQLKKQKNNEVAREILDHEDFPREPWKDAKTLLDEAEAAKIGEEPEAEEPTEESGEIEKSPPSKTYVMIQRITRLSQHYLTNQSPLLRRRLLYLISTACQALHNNEDEFLPLVNDIWPVLIKRLYDEEPFVRIAASEAISELCRSAGDFLSSRIQTEWHDLMRFSRQVQIKAQAEKKGRHARGIYAQNWQVWEAMVSLLITIVEYVRIGDEMFDEVLEILAELLGSRDDVRSALCVVNADAVWLAEVSQGLHRDRPVPVLYGYQFAEIQM